MEVQRAVSWFYTLPRTGFGTAGNCGMASAVPFHTFEMISTYLLVLTFEISMLLNKETHTHMSPAWASGLYVLWGMSDLVNVKRWREPKVFQIWALLHGVKIQQTDNSQQNNQVNTRTQKWTASHVTFVSSISTLSNIICGNPHQGKPKVSHHAVLTLQTSAPQSRASFKLNSWPFQQLSPESRQAHHHL